MQIPFNKPFFTGKEVDYINQAINNGSVAGKGEFTNKCQSFFEQKFGIKKCLLTTSCTDALELATLLLDIKSGDEVIVPSYTFVSTANAFVLRGANIVFADSSNISPNIDADKIEQLITPKTKVIVVMHYNGVSCDMDKIMAVANKHGIYVVEDAAQAINSYCNGKVVGSQGHLSAFSFHETKNIISGEGGMLAINDDALVKRAEIICEKGTNRSAFLRGEVKEYSWMDVGSSFYPSELTAAFLWAQLQKLDSIQNTRFELWDTYYNSLLSLANNNAFYLPEVDENNKGNGHVFYIVLPSKNHRDELSAYLNSKGISAVFHYLALHKSPYFSDKYIGEPLPNSERYTNCLLRLPLYNGLQTEEQDYIIQAIKEYYK